MDGHPNAGEARDFMALVAERGLLAQCTDPAGLPEALARPGAAAYAGFDATADSLHVGHLLPLMALRWAMRLGVGAVALVGGATSLVGDPSFRNSARPMLTDGEVASNAAGVRACIAAVLDGAGTPEFVDNAEWLSGMGHVEFLRDVGAHFTVARLLAMESVRTRLGDGLTALEFGYTLLQAADFRELARRRNCVLQVGGSDQWGNICNGIELARRTDGTDGTDLFGLTVPLVTTSSGAKMGKTADGAVWLAASRTSALAFRQFWRNVDDADAGRFLGLFTEIPMDEVRRLAALGGSEANLAKEVLADAVTEMVRGRAAADEAGAQAKALFSGVGRAEPIHVAAGSPARLIDLLVGAGLSTTLGEARRLVRGGGAAVDGVRAQDEAATLASGTFRLSAGRRRAAVVAVP